jgi:hypothetical protein
MILTNPTVEILKEKYTDNPEKLCNIFLTDIHQHIERCGNPHRREDIIDEISSEEYLMDILKSNDKSMLEHGTVYLSCLSGGDKPSLDILHRYEDNPHSKVNQVINQSLLVGEECLFYNITTNLRVIDDNDWQDDLRFLCYPTESHHQRITLKWNVDNIMVEELLKHKEFSFYVDDSIIGEFVYIKPAWWRDENYEITETEIDILLHGLRFCEIAHNALIQGMSHNREINFDPWIEERARLLLPNALRRTVIMTGFVSDLQGFIPKEISNHNLKDLVKELYNKLQKTKYLKQLEYENNESFLDYNNGKCDLDACDVFDNKMSR